MWGGSGGSTPPGDSDENARLAATALAAYSTGNASAALLPPQNEMEALLMLQQQQQQQRMEEEAVRLQQRQNELTEQQQLTTETVPSQPSDETEQPDSPEEAPVQPRGKPEAMAKKLGEARIKREQEEAAAAEEEAKKKEETTPKPKKKKKASPQKASRKKIPSGPTMDDPVEPMKDVEYENVVKLMEQFCKVPLLAEFSRPVALLHPELIPVYTKIVHHPMDMGKVCRSVRRRDYKNTRDIRLDMWRIFYNCIKYHTHPSNKDRSVPSFCSIALHLREYFNSLWQEYMLPSDPTGKTKASRAAFEKRDVDRTNRLKATSAAFFSSKTLEKAAGAIRDFLKSGGLVDSLDETRVLVEAEEDDDEGDVDVIVENLQRFQRKLLQVASSLQSGDEQGAGDYTVGEFVADCRKCFDAPDLLQNRPSLKVRIQNRTERIMGKILCPIYEANGRGVNQSSIWGCMAATIWARESSKKPYWPALVLGIMAPDDQKEDWHKALTDRNEERLPEKLRAELQSGKKKAEQALKRQNQGTSERQSFFLVEFMGTHEFIWVKENDIIENFDPDDDPNQNIAAGNVTKKKRSSRVSSYDVTRSKMYGTGIEEAQWALEEFEMQLNDTCGDLAEDDDDADEDGEQGYSYSVLCQSDDEAEEVPPLPESVSDVEELNELLATDGLPDFTVAGRKEAKKRATARKKLKADADKAALKKEKAELARKQKLAAKKSKAAAKKKGKAQQSLEKREQKELERRRKKRGRERERVLKEELRKNKRRRTDGQDKGIPDKRGRAHAIVKGYLTRLAKSDSSLMGNALTIPASAVDSSGLLGMALAFRAAAGEIILHDQDPSFQKPKPYDLVDTKGPAKSSERVKKLEEQLELLQKEVEHVKKNTARRKELTQQALRAGEEIYQDILKREQEAKKSDVKKRKKYVKGAKKATPKKDAYQAEKAEEDDASIKGEAELKTDEQLEDEAAAPMGDEKMDESFNGDEADTPQKSEADDHVHDPEEREPGDHDAEDQEEADHEENEDESHREEHVVDTPDHSADELEKEQPTMEPADQFEDAEEDE